MDARNEALPAAAVAEHRRPGWDPETREAYRAEAVAAIPGWYSPWAHLLFPSLVTLALLVLAIARIHDLRAWELLVVPAVFIGANAFEWRVHKGLLHRRSKVKPLAILYERHTPMHHRIFLTEDMTMRSTREFALVLMPAVGAVGVAIADLPFFFGLLTLGLGNVAWLFMVSSVAYFLTYEWFHLAYHLPEESFVGRRRLIRVLRRHHAIHHHPERMAQWNFNVTLPLWDWLRGTVYPERLPVGSEAHAAPAATGAPVQRTA